MTVQLFKTSAWTITAAILFLLSFVTPSLAAPLLLIGALVAGLLGYFRKEWGGIPAIFITMVSVLFLVVVLYNLL